MRRLVLAGLLLLPGAALAQDRPLLRPTRDVDVTYRIDPAHGLLTQRMRWDVAGHKLRVDPPSRGIYMLLDFATHTMSMVQVTARQVLDTPAPDSAQPLGGATGAVRAGTARVAGLDCTQWDMRDAAGKPVQACLTDDGVLLQAQAEGRVLLEAETVRYAPADPADFAIPPDFVHLQPPAAR